MTSLAPPGLLVRRSVASSDGSLSLWAALAMAGASGCLLALGYALHPVWWAAWLAPAPLLAAAAAGPPSRVRLLGLVAGLTAGITTFSYDVEIATIAGAVAMLVGRGLLWSAATAFTARAVRRTPLAVAVFALPLFVSAADTLVLLVSPYAGDGSLAHSQLGALPVIQVASVGGTPAVLFVVLSGGGLLGLLVARLLGAPLPTRGLIKAVLAASFVVAAALIFGAARLDATAPGRGLSVAMVTTDALRTRPTSWKQVWSVYGPSVTAAARSGSLVMTPEKIALLGPEDAHVAERQLSQLALEHGATLVVGLETRYGAGRFFNQALVVTPDGRTRWYNKQRLVPGMEARDTPGGRPLVLDVAGTRLGVAICKDMHAPDLGRTYGRLGVQLMVVPAFDFDRDGWLSDRLSVLRGVESGYAIVRASRHGVSSVSDRYGRILAEASSASEGVVVLRGEAPLSGNPTIYSHIGDAVGWALLLAALSLGLVMWRGPPVRSAAVC